jgi:hypothetical protein
VNRSNAANQQHRKLRRASSAASGFALCVALLFCCVAAPGAAPPRSFADFKPSAHGFRFTNSFSGSPLPSALASLGALAGAPTQFGLCGGMSSSAADYYLARREAPTLDKPPKQGTPLYQYLYQRQVASLGAGLAAAGNFADWMQRSEDGVLGTRHLTGAGLPAILADIELGKPVVLGLVHVGAADRRPIWENHQVLAFRASSRPAGTDLLIYDPNHPGNDAVIVHTEPVLVGTLLIPGAIDIRLPVIGRESQLQAAATATRPKREKVVRGFFAMPYGPVMPPDGL